MEEFKSPASRLARFFKKSRDAWKAKNAEKQKQIRALQIKVRDLSESRDRWKQKAKAAQRELTQPQVKSVQSSEKETEAENVLEGELLPKNSSSFPKGHVYPTFIIQLAVQQLIQGIMSFRASQLNFQLFSQFFELATPSFSSIRNWLYRLGFYALLTPKEHRDDWIIIPDFTVELGKLRCLVILGVPQSRFCIPKRLDKNQNQTLGLQHSDVEVLAIEVLSRSTGETIETLLEQLTTEIGTPLQIVADHGSDLKCGIERYQQKNQNVIYTHDITHHLGLLFKHTLEKDDKYQVFCQQCSLTRGKIQQTELHFLTPPKPNYKSRYLNVDAYVKWANQIFDYQAKNDYSQISTAYFLDEETYISLIDKIDKKTLDRLKKIKTKIYNDKKSFIEALMSVCDYQTINKYEQIICMVASFGRRRFLKNFGWLEDYRSELLTYGQMVKIALDAEALLKRTGLKRNSKRLFEKKLAAVKLSKRSQFFKKQIVDYLIKEGQKIPKGKTLLASSDVIESLFGKYKAFTPNNCLRELGKRILTIPLCTLSLTEEFIKTAMESVREVDVENWANRVFGQSNLSKRREAFRSHEGTQK